MIGTQFFELLTRLEDILDFCLQLSHEVNIVDGLWYLVELVAGAGGLEAFPLGRHILAQFAKQVFTFGHLGRMKKISTSCFSCVFHPIYQAFLNGRPPNQFLVAFEFL